MAYRIYNALKRVAVSAAIRFAPLTSQADLAVEPLRRDVDDFNSRDLTDDWLFDTPGSMVSAAGAALSSELSRVSSALGELREILSGVMDHTPLEMVPVNMVTAPNFRWEEDVLFDGDMTEPRLDAPVLSGEAAFLFDDEPVATSWTVLRPTLSPESLPA